MVARLCLDVRAARPIGCSRAAIAKAAKKRWAMHMRSSLLSGGWTDTVYSGSRV
jgi:hypothetical protein